MRLTTLQAQTIAQVVIEALTIDDDRGRRVWQEDVNGGNLVETLTAIVDEVCDIDDEPASDDEGSET